MAESDRRKQGERRVRDEFRGKGWPQEHRLKPDRRTPEVAESTMGEFEKAMQEFSATVFEKSSWKR